ncbi:MULTISPECIES: amidohydrolase family protein [Rhizobium/Agrobacterium group]|uniref:Amidohydrolase n=2 Tax=Agrobacterium tumefaciens complex TaxID=1183400 RepID=A0AAE6BMR7_AGRTU|nr:MULTISPECIES: amidohydrolase [Rhizobium/Agrobacterium group]KRA57051.1 amidohydrolase [Rhizobium sp. Root651]MCA2370112.1 amidohydrolase [Agrobacterium tomkonis CIP 111-78]QCL90065.1 amidohydrolase [Agrobacterium tumefaciens]QCM00982.1 amidohydrolase [Agrobacterium tumefaciens]TKT59553.1 amidohydrolase [Agrobacterium sp. LC34]
MLIDAHQHFWLMKDRAGQWPPPALAAIYRDFLPADLSPLLAEAGVSGTVLVQTMETAADTDFMLELADKTGFIKGVVGWVDMKSPDAATEIARRAKHSAFRGVRPMLQGIEDVAWIDDPALDTAVDALVKHGLVFDALVLPPNLPHLLSFARRHPQLPVVIDHGAKPLIATGHYSGWRSDMAALAALPNVHCKLSGLLTERGDQRPEAVRPYAETILELFGANRVIFGSDWPVLRLAGDYQVWLDFCRDIVPAEDYAAVFGGNAIRFYSLSDR